MTTTEQKQTKIALWVMTKTIDSRYKEIQGIGKIFQENCMRNKAVITTMKRTGGQAIFDLCQV